MDRRESLKSMFVGTLAGGLVMQGCGPSNQPEGPENQSTNNKGYGRTPKETLRDEMLKAETFFNPHEAETLAVLWDIILPADEEFGSASDAEVPAFIEFISKDIPKHQLPLRGGLMWLDNRCNEKFGKEFKLSSADQQFQLCDEIAFPEVEDPELQPGIRFFTLVRNLTLTGYYTSEMGIKDLGYKGNIPNVWDGVPDEVLKQHGVSYEEEWLKKCIDQKTRAQLAEWDDEGNLIT